MFASLYIATQSDPAVPNHPITFINEVEDMCRICRFSEFCDL